jgi:flagellar basal-body rod modification protein FlgD
MTPTVTNPTVTTPAPPATNPTTPAASGTTGIVGSQTIAGNFNTFLQLLTTQLKNQNPLSPLDTNQFTQQLVEFAGVEQQINMNTQLGSLISLQQTAQATNALNFVGATVGVNGNVAQLANGQATWSFNAPKAANASISIADSSGKTVFTATGPIQAGPQSYTWNGRDSSGNSLPAGSYTMTITATDATGAPVAISTQVKGVVDSVDVSKNPPMLSIGGQNVPLNQITQVFRSGF